MQNWESTAQCSVHLQFDWSYFKVSYNGGGWFISWKILIYGWWLGIPLWLVGNLPISWFVPKGILVCNDLWGAICLGIPRFLFRTSPFPTVLLFFFSASFRFSFFFCFFCFSASVFWLLFSVLRLSASLFLLFCFSAFLLFLLFGHAARLVFLLSLLFFFSACFPVLLLSYRYSYNYNYNYNKNNRNSKKKNNKNNRNNKNNKGNKIHNNNGNCKEDQN